MSRPHPRGRELDYDGLALRNCARQQRLRRVRRRLWRMGVATYLVGLGALAVGWTDRSVLALLGLPLAVALCLGVPYGAYLWWRQTESTAVWIGRDDEATATAIGATSKETDA
jgi:hypothetical protein